MQCRVTMFCVCYCEEGMCAVEAGALVIQTGDQSLFGSSSGLRKWRPCTSQSSDATERRRCVCQKYIALFFFLSFFFSPLLSSAPSLPCL